MCHENSTPPSCNAATHSNNEPGRREHHVSGFYFNGLWRSLLCQNRQFTTPEIHKCLAHSNVYLFGDSTLRQWYLQLANFFNETITESRGNHYIGPHFAVDSTVDFKMTYNFHGLPVRVPVWVNVTDLLYIPNVLNNIKVDGDGDNVVIVLSLWAHFTSNNLDFYRQRWKSIKKSLLKFTSRHPRTRIFIKSASTREPKFDLSNWYAWELDKLMRSEMSQISRVTIIDTWDMTTGHHTGYNVHPADEVVAQQVFMLLSYICR